MTKAITREEIKAKLDNNQPINIVETLPKMYYDAEHLPGAINIPHEQVREMATHLLPDIDALVVVYCASSECQNSRIAANTLRQMGYTQVFEYVEGKKHWLEAKYPVHSSN